MRLFFIAIFSLLSGPAKANPRTTEQQWSTELRQSIPDAMAAELALKRAGLQPRQASLVYGRTQWKANETGNVQAHTTLGWRQLIGPEVVEEASAAPGQSKTLCNTLSGHDPIPGGRVVQFYRQAPPRDDDVDSQRREPRFILGTTSEHEVLITALRPGDQLQITEAIPVGGGPVEERMELQRDGRQLSVTRLGHASRVCLNDAS